MRKQHKQDLLLKCNNKTTQPSPHKSMNHLHQNSLTGSFYCGTFLQHLFFSKGKWSSKAHARWMADLSWMKGIAEKSTMAPCTAITNWPECAGSHATMSLVQATLFKWLHPCLPVEMAQMSLLAFERVGEENRTCQPGRDQQGNKRSIRFRLGELY